MTDLLAKMVDIQVRVLIIYFTFTLAMTPAYIRYSHYRAST